MLRNLLLLCAVFFLACNSRETTNTTAVTAHAHQEALSLNNGVKWKADESTRTHAAKLNAEIAAFNKLQTTDKEQYQAFGSKMQIELNGLLKDCRMMGAEHEALHSWLEPVLERVNELKVAGSASQGAATVQELTAEVQKFNQYFN